MGIPPAVPVKAAKSIGPCPLLSRGLSRQTTASTPSGGMPGRPGGVAPRGRTATHTESTLYQDRAVSAGRHQCPNVGRKAVLLAWRDGEAQIEQTFQNLDRCLKAAAPQKSEAHRVRLNARLLNQCPAKHQEHRVGRPLRGEGEMEQTRPAVVFRRTGLDPEQSRLVMGRALCNWLGWKRSAK